jgi:hypothetical protein
MPPGCGLTPLSLPSRITLLCSSQAEPITCCVALCECARTRLSTILLPCGASSTLVLCCPVLCCAVLCSVCTGMPINDLLDNGDWNPNCANSVVVGGTCPGICDQGRLTGSGWLKTSTATSQLHADNRGIQDSKYSMSFQTWA